MADVDEMQSSGAVCRQCRALCSRSHAASAAVTDNDNEDDRDNRDVTSWIYSHSRLTTSVVAAPTSCRLCFGAVVNDSLLAAMVTDRCRALAAGARLCPQVAASDRAIAARFVDAVQAMSTAASQLRAGISRAQSDLADLVRDIHRRLAFHVRVGLAGVRTSFVNGFADAFKVVRERSLLPLVAGGGYDTVANLERTVKQLAFTSLSETVARQVCLNCKH